MEQEKLIPELKDIREMIYRYNTIHKEGCFIFDFVGFKKDPTHKCIDCGEDCDMVDNEKSLQGLYGDKETLRMMLNNLRDLLEDYECEEGEEGFINL